RKHPCDETPTGPTKPGGGGPVAPRGPTGWPCTRRSGRGGLPDPLPDVGEDLAGLVLAQRAQGHAFAAQEQLQPLARLRPRMVEVDVVRRAQHRPVAGEAAHGPRARQRLVAVSPVVALAVDVDHDRLPRRRGYFGHFRVPVAGASPSPGFHPLAGEVSSAAVTRR